MMNFDTVFLKYYSFPPLAGVRGWSNNMLPPPNPRQRGKSLSFNKVCSSLVNQFFYFILNNIFTLSTFGFIFKKLHDESIVISLS